MRSLTRSGPRSTTQLLLQVLDRPELVSAVRELPVPALGRLIERIGLEDAGQLVALLSSEQIRGVFDDDLWKAGAPGEDERFRPERFALWLEILAEGGEDFLIDQICALPRDLLALAVHRLVLVVDVDALWEGVAEATDEIQRLERALDAPLFEEWEEFRLLARDPRHWDVVWSALVSLDRDHHPLLREILERCCALSADFIDEQGGLYEVLTSEEMLEGDVAAEREDRRAAQGYVAPADARAFLELARRGDSLETRAPVTKAYFRGLSSQRPAPSMESTDGTRAGSEATRAANATKLVRLLEEVVDVDAASASPLAELGAGSPATDGQGDEIRTEPSVPAPTRPSAPLLQAALAHLQQQHPDLWSRRMEELGYLANVLVAGSRGRRPRPIEALERALAICNTGLERALGGDRSLAGASEQLAKTPADLLFRWGYAGSQAHAATNPERDP